MAEALRRYIGMLDSGDYFEAHEILEAVWYPMRRERNDLTNLLKGLINGAVAFEHLKRGKPGAQERARKVMHSFDRFSPICDTVIPERQLFRAACKRVVSLKKAQSGVFDVLVP